MTEFDDNLKVSIKKLKKVWNPFEITVWIKLDDPITIDEIKKCLENNELMSPDEYAEVKLFSNIPAIQLAKASHCVRPLCGVALRDGMFVVRK